MKTKIGFYENEDDIAFLDLNDVNLTDTFRLADRLNDLLDHGKYKIVLNLENSYFFRGSGFNVFFAALKSAISFGAMVTCVNKNNVPDTTPLREIVPIFMNEETALQWFKDNSDKEMAASSGVVIRKIKMLKGVSLKVRARKGNFALIERVGILEEIYPHLFVIIVEENRNRTRRVSYSYPDMLRKNVELIDTNTGEPLIPWL